MRPITVTLTVTDSAGRQGVSSQVVNSKAFTEVNNGGGEIGPGALVILAFGLLGALLRRRAPSAGMLRGRPPRGGSPDSHNR